MEMFFQSFSPLVKAIESLIHQKKRVKIFLADDAINFKPVDLFEEGEEEKGAMEFFLFIKKRVAHLDVSFLPMGEREALLDVMAVLELYIEKYLKKESRVAHLLESEIFSLRIGSQVPRKYLNKPHVDIAFIKVNNLDKVLFYHGIALKFHQTKGISFPFKGDHGTIRDIFFSDLKVYALNSISKYYFDGDYLFTTNNKGELLSPFSIEDQAFTTNISEKPFIVYRYGFPQSCLEIYQRQSDFYIILHDGAGSAYRFGISNKKLIFPDQFAYEDCHDFEKIVLPISENQVSLCLEELYKTRFQESSELMAFLLMKFNFEDYFNYLTSKSKVLSLFYIPVVIIKAVLGKTSWKNVLTPWKAYEIDYRRLKEKGDELRKSSSL